MGLDLVELVMAVEDRFEVELSDDEAVHAETPGKLIDLVYAKVGQADSAGCLTSHVFYSVRRALMQLFEWHRSQVVPDARLEHLIPRKGRREQWLRLRDALQVGLGEPMKRPPLVVWLISILCSLLLIFAIMLRFDAISFWVTLPAVFVVWLLALLATRPLCLEIPPHLATVGQLTRYLVAYAPKLADAKSRGWTRADVAAAIRELTIAELGIHPQDYREDAHFVKDLRAS